jgi:hypothetical protein
LGRQIDQWFEHRSIAFLRRVVFRRDDPATML